MAWDAWWIWAVGGLALLILEALVPGFAFLGFGVSVLAVAALLAFAPGWLPSLPVALLVAAALAIPVWLGLRRLLGIRKGQTKVWRTDINED